MRRCTVSIDTSANCVTTTGNKHGNRRGPYFVSIMSVVSRREESAPLLGEPAGDNAKEKSGLPLRHFVGIFLSATCNGIQVMLIFTIAVYIVRGFGVDDEVKVGRLTGILTSLYQLGQFCTSYLWGRISDRVGRKAVVVFANVSNTATVLLLGLVQNYPQACFVRFLGGALNGIPGTLRTMAGESGTDGDQASVLLIMTMGWGMGTTLGPTIGATFSNPCETYGSSFPLCGEGELLDHRKFLLPCVVALLVNMTGVVASLFMNETLNSKRQNHQQQSVEPQTATSSAINHQHGRQAEPGQSATSLPQVPSLGYLTDQDPEANEAHQPSAKWWQLRSVRAALTGVSTVALINTMWDEITPIYASSPVSKGGLGLKTSELGIPLTLGGLALFLFALLGYKRLQRRFGVTNLTRYGLCIYAPLAMTFPLVSLLMPDHKHAALVMLSVTLVLRATTGTSVSTSAAMITNMSSPKRQLGEVNGFGMTMMALMRALGPAIGGFVWSTTLALNIPEHQFVTYALVAAGAIATSFLYRSTVINLSAA